MVRDLQALFFVEKTNEVAYISGMTLFIAEETPPSPSLSFINDTQTNNHLASETLAAGAELTSQRGESPTFLHQLQTVMSPEPSLGVMANG